MEAMNLTYLQNDVPLTAQASGGIFAYTALGRQGIMRDTHPSSYDATGYVKPLIVLKARAPVALPDIFDEKEKIVSQSQVVEFWMYQWVGYDIIEIMGNHLHRLLQGHKFDGYYPVMWDMVTGPMIDGGSLKGASVVRRDYYFKNILVAV
jgi:hypothetical protein